MGNGKIRTLVSFMYETFMYSHFTTMGFTVSNQQGHKGRRGVLLPTVLIGGLFLS